MFTYDHPFVPLLHTGHTGTGGGLRPQVTRRRTGSMSRALRRLAFAGVMAAPALLCLTAACASALASLPRGDYGVRQVCGAPAPGEVSCLALQLLPMTAAAEKGSGPASSRRRTRR